MPISLTCAGCSAVIMAPDQYAGQRGKCQKCGNVFLVPFPAAIPVAMPSAALPQCRFCKGELVIGAVKCRHCGEFVDPIHMQDHNRGMAALISLFIPGGGQMYRGQVGRGVCWLVAAIFGYFLFIIPGLLVHGFSVYDASLTVANQ